MEKIILFGGGGHCKVVIDAIRKKGEYEISGIVDPGLKVGDRVLGVEVIGGDEVIADLPAKGIKNAFVAIGSVGDCTLRKSLSKNILKAGLNTPVIVHPSAVVAEDVKIGLGTFIAASATINPGTEVGQFVIINTSSSIDHDCEIGDFVHIGPGVTLSGGVKVGEETHIGTGANVTQYLEIGKQCLITAGTLIKRNVKDKTKESLNYDTKISEW